jgi:hypothetical protein
MSEKEPVTPQVLGERVRNLEDEFFRKEDERLVQRLRELKAKEATHEALSRASGITNKTILDKLVNLGIRPEIVGALGVVPLVEVAWADGKLDDKERQTVLDRSGRSGVAVGSTAYELLRNWLDHRPDAGLLTAWTHMVQGLCEHMSPDEREQLRTGLIERVRAVATASGGILGVGAISSAEADVIRQLDAAFGAR